MLVIVIISSHYQEASFGVPPWLQDPAAVAAVAAAVGSGLALDEGMSLSQAVPRSSVPVNGSATFEAATAGLATEKTALLAKTRAVEMPLKQALT